MADLTITAANVLSCSGARTEHSIAGAAITALNLDIQNPGVTS